VRMSDTQIRGRQDFAVEQNITTIRNRVDQIGVSEPLVQRQGVDRIIVQLPGLQDPEELNKILTATATLEFRLVDTAGDSPGSRHYPGRAGISGQLLKREVIASGDQIVDAESGFSEGQPAVFINLDSAGGDRMLENTRANLNKPMATVFIETRRETVDNPDGTVGYRTIRTEEIINTATIRGVFKNSFRTTGLSAGEARDLALLLRAGALAAPVYKVEDRTIGPSLGQDNIDRGFNAVLIGFLAVIVFMAIYYRGFGLIADMALFANLVLIVALLSLLQASLTLPGIAGIVLTVGMAVDANVLIFERIREELVSGNSVQGSIHSGYEKAFSSIADANITTLIAAVVLFAFGTGISISNDVTGSIKIFGILQSHQQNLIDYFRATTNSFLSKPISEVLAVCLHAARYCRIHIDFEQYIHATAQIKTEAHRAKAQSSNPGRQFRCRRKRNIRDAGKSIAQEVTRLLLMVLGVERNDDAAVLNE